MYRIFVTAISLQGKGRLLKMVYQPKDFSLEKNLETSFPIVPIIANQVDKGEEIKVIAIRTDNIDTPDNYEILVEELAQLGVGREQITEISVAENQNRETGRELLLHILEAIPNDSLVYGDITFGTKPMSAILLYALSFIEKVKDTEVQGIYYGEVPREGGVPVYEKAALYDLTHLKCLGDVIDQLYYMDVSDPLASLRKLLNQ